jgi:hypothetical protein
LPSFDLLRARKLFEDASDILAVAVTHLDDAISASRGGVDSAAQPASSDRSAFSEVVNDHYETRAKEEAQDATILDAARARLAAREQGGGGKPQKRTTRSFCEHETHRIAGLVSENGKCRYCDRPHRAPRGSEPRKRSPRSR